jgi:plasmid stability protein
MVHDLDDDIRDRLQELSRRHGRSLEEEIRDILRSAVGTRPSNEASEGLGTGISHGVLS